MQLKTPDSQLQEIRHLDTCTVTDAIASLRVRLHNQGYSDSRIRCLSEHSHPMVGYAVTGRIRSAEPPMVGNHFVERQDWFKYVVTRPEPRVVVLQDMDHTPGSGAFWDEVHARIHLRLGCVGAVTNGAVRDLPRIRETDFYLFAGQVTASQGYAHIIDMGHPVEVGGLVIRTGDLIHGDIHGVVDIPHGILADLPGTAKRILQARQRIMQLCASEEFTFEKLLALLREMEQ